MRAALVASLPRLKKLDGVDVTGRERDDAMAAFDEDEDEDEGEREGEGRTRGTGATSAGCRAAGRARTTFGGESRRFLREERVDSRVVVLRRRRSISRDTSHAPMLEDPMLEVDAMGAAVRSLALDAKLGGDGRSRRDDGSIQRETRAGDADDDADLTMEARVMARRRQDASITEAGTMMPFDEFAGPEVL